MSNATRIPLIPPDHFKVISGQVITTSLNVAEVFGKRHTHVIDAIKNIEIPDDFSNVPIFRPVEIIEKNAIGGKVNKSYYELNRDGFTFLVMGFTGKKAAKFKWAYISAFNKMEKLLLGQQRKALRAPGLEAMPEPPPDPCDALERLIKELGVVPSPRKCLGIGWKKPMYIITENVQNSFPEVLNINMTLRNIHYFESDKVKEKVERLVRLFAEMLTNVPFNGQEG